MRAILRTLGVLLAIASFGTAGFAAELKVLTTGAMKAVVVALVPDFEKEAGHTVTVANDTAGGLQRRIAGGEPFDLVVLTPGALKEVAAKIAGAPVSIARVGVGVVVREGAPVPNVATVEAFKTALKAAKSVAYIDPASGGSSGIYLAGLFEKLGIADDIRPKAKLKKGGYVAELIANGEAELGLHQISEILPVKGVTLAGPLPAEIQNYTTYAAAISANTAQSEAAQAFLKVLTGPKAAALLKERGMERPPSS